MYGVDATKNVANKCNHNLTMELVMPVITMTLGADQIGQKQKNEFISSVTQSAARITNIPEQSFIVFIEQLDPDNVGVGGLSLTEKRKLA